MGERGPKKSFSDVSCPNPSCKLFGRLDGDNIVANGTYKTDAGPVRKFICRRCGRVFNERTGTAYEGIRSSPDMFDKCIRMLNSGMSVRAVAGNLGCSKDTVLRWSHAAGIQSENVSSKMESDLEPESVQMDEAWAIVKKNQL